MSSSKDLHDDYSDAVRLAFSPRSFVGLRSLPNALDANFSKRLNEAIEIKKNAQPIQYNDTGSKTLYVAAGQVKPGKYSGGPDVFTTFEYQEDPIDRERKMKNDTLIGSKQLWVSDKDFKTVSLPIPKFAGSSFNEFEYKTDPYEAKDEWQKHNRAIRKEKVLNGPIRAGGKVNLDDGTMSKIRVGEAIMFMACTLSRDWSRGFSQIFEDETGCIVACFEESLIEDSGEMLVSYMDNMSKSDSTITEFCFRRDPTQWGITRDDNSHVCFVFWPPWVHTRIDIPLHLRNPVALDNTSFISSTDPALVSGRIPFGPQTEAGKQIYMHVRTYDRSFKV